MYPPLTLIDFKLVPGQVPALADTGTVRSCNPDRVALKKVVLTGYPVRWATFILLGLSVQRMRLQSCYVDSVVVVS